MNYDNESGIISVSRLNYIVNHSLSINFPLLKVEGEVSQLLVSKLGHAYFTLKDKESCIRCVFFRAELKGSTSIPVNGDLIVVTASPAIYSTRGDFQLRVSNLTKAGNGKLYEQYLKLKQKLFDEGLFDPEKKLNVPEFFNCVGIVASIDSAALKDALITFHNKLGRVKLKIFPSLVQGGSASIELARALDVASLDSEVDVILLIRGGGSIEDLLVFNNEKLIRAIAKISKPIITGIGHESDTTLVDLVADCRAATPTAAVERLVVEEEKSINKLKKNQLKLSDLINSYIYNFEQKIDFLFLKLKSPRDKIAINEHKFNNIFQRLKNVRLNMFHNLIFKLDYHKININVCG
tara:strand:+ start:697 stop:1749 length:1053 start_codon:yes stop_codon:yes gene_type:complete